MTDPIIGRRITKEEDFVTFDPPRYPVDMSSFGPGGRGFVCLKQDSQKADDGEVRTYMWDHFSADSFLRKFRSHMPEGWRRAALDGFRRPTCRRWRRNLLQSFHRWRSKSLRGKLESTWTLCGLENLETVKGNLPRVRRDYTNAVTLYSMVDPLLPIQLVTNLP